MSKIKVSIIHYYPLEFFPPVTNLLNVLSGKSSEFLVTAISSHNNKNRNPFTANKIKIWRFPFVKPKDLKFVRSLKYVYFNLGCLLKLFIQKPNAIMYYETISAWPVYIFTKYINKQCKVFIHYHEYASPEWYQKYMKMVKLFHGYEVGFLYEHASWISQTNTYRLDLFQKDYPFIQKSKLSTLPNYPPQKWRSIKSSETHNNVTKIVYVGSLSFEGSYIKEFCEWVIQQENVTLDIYAYNVHCDVADYLNELNNTNINFFSNGIDYNEMPKVLCKYDVGVILHKAYNENYKFNATNKLFEYLICDLDVWFNSELLGCADYIQEETWPCVLPMNFKDLNSENLKLNMEHPVLLYSPKVFSCEDVYESFIINMKSALK